MLFPARLLDGIVDGSMDRAFRRWDRPRVKVGGRQRTAIGVIGFEAVESVEPDALTAEDADRAGFGSLEALRRAVERRPERTLYCIRFGLVGPDPRVALRERVPDAAERRELRERLSRLDRASRHGPWTLATLRAIRERPGVPAADLAAGLGREKLPFKLDVRKLKELGLTESLRPGYRLSPRGRAMLDNLRSSATTERGDRAIQE